MSAPFVIAFLLSFAFLVSTPTAFPVHSYNGTAVDRALPEKPACERKQDIFNPSLQYKGLSQEKTDFVNYRDHKESVLSNEINRARLKFLQETSKLVLKLLDDMKIEMGRKFSESKKLVDFLSANTRTEVTNKDFQLTPSPEFKDFSPKGTNEHSNLNSPGTLDYTEKNEEYNYPSLINLTTADFQLTPSPEFKDFSSKGTNEHSNLNTPGTLDYAEKIEEYNYPSLTNLTTESMAHLIGTSVTLDHAKENIKNSFPLSNEFSENETHFHLIPDTSLISDYSAENTEDNLENQEMRIEEFNKATLTSGTEEENTDFISSHSDSIEKNLKGLYSSETRLDSTRNSFQLPNLLSTAALNKTPPSPTTEANVLTSTVEEKIHDGDIMYSSMKTMQHTQAVNNSFQNSDPGNKLFVEITAFNKTFEESNLKSPSKIGNNYIRNNIKITFKNINLKESFDGNVTSAHKSHSYQSNKSTNTSYVTKLPEFRKTLKFYFGLPRSNESHHHKNPVDEIIAFFPSERESNTKLHFNNTKPLNEQTALKTSTVELISSEPRENIRILKPVQIVPNSLDNTSLGYLKTGLNYTTPLPKPLHNSEVDLNGHDIIEYKDYDEVTGNSDMSLEGANDPSLSVLAETSNITELPEFRETNKFYFGIHRMNGDYPLEKPIAGIIALSPNKSESNTTLPFNDTKSLNEQISTVGHLNSEPNENIGILKTAVQIVPNSLDNTSLGYLKTELNYTTPLPKPLHNSEVDLNGYDIIEYKDYDEVTENSDMSLEGAKDPSLFVPVKTSNITELPEFRETFKFYFGIHRMNGDHPLVNPIVFPPKSESNTTLPFNDTKSLNEQTSTVGHLNSEPDENIGILKKAVQIVPNSLDNTSLGYLNTELNYITAFPKPLHNPEVDSNGHDVTKYKDYDEVTANSDMSLGGAKDPSLFVPGKVENNDLLDHDLEAYKRSNNLFYKTFQTEKHRSLSEEETTTVKSDNSHISVENYDKVTTMSKTKELLVPDTNLAYEAVENVNVPEKLDTSPDETEKMVVSEKPQTKKKFLEAKILLDKLLYEIQRLIHKAALK